MSVFQDSGKTCFYLNQENKLVMLASQEDLSRENVFNHKITCLKIIFLEILNSLENVFHQLKLSDPVKVQLFWKGRKNLRFSPYGFEFCLLLVNVKRRMTQIFGAFSEKLNFWHISIFVYPNYVFMSTGQLSSNFLKVFPPFFLISCFKNRSHHQLLVHILQQRYELVERN